MKQPLKSQVQTSYLKIKRRCAFRSNRISWCKKLTKICDAPNEYNLCSSYQPKPFKNELKLPQKEQSIHKNEEAAYSPHTLLLGTKIGQCDICKATKKTLLLRYGFCLCEDCLSVCTTILEQLQFGDTKEKTFVVRENPLSSLNKTQKKA